MEAFNKFYLDVLKTKYALFDGRAGRQEYWMYAAFNFGIAIGLYILSTIVPNLAILSILFALATLVPSIGIGIRRLHDVGKPGIYLLIALIPIVGALILIFMFLIKPSDPGTNAYGAQS